MPIYEYRCDACGHELEALQKLSDPRLTDCPECASDSLRRLISRPSFRLKGSGWYETDFKSDKDKQRNLATGKDDKPESTDDKPAAKETKETKESKETKETKESKESKESKASDGGAKPASGQKDSGTAAA